MAGRSASSSAKLASPDASASVTMSRHVVVGSRWTTPLR